MSVTSIEESLPFNFGGVESCNNIWLTLTNLCNIHCKYCFNYVSRCHEHMPAKLALAIITSHLSNLDNTESKPFQVNYFGGEPTLNHDALIQAIDFINDNDIHNEQCLMTNGVFNERVLSALLDKNIDFQVSFDGELNNLRFNKNLTVAVYEKTVKNIEKLVEVGEKVTIRSTIHRDNVANMNDLVRFCAKYQITQLKIAPICDFGDAKLYAIKQPPLGEYIDRYHNAYELGRQYGVHIELKGTRYLASMSQRKMAIPFVWLPDGHVAMTITHATSKAEGAGKIIIGKYNELDGHIDVNHEQINQMKRNFVQNREKYCSDCPIKDICCGNLQFTPFATDTFIPARDRYFCDLGIKMVKQFPE